MSTDGLTLKEHLLLEGARRSDLKYTEKKVKDVLDRVTVELKGNESGSITKLAARYDRLENAIKMMGKKRDELNAVLKAEAEELFAATDIVLTRVIETVSFTLTISKLAKQKPKVDVDYEAILAELRKMIGDDLQPQVDAIIETYTKITPREDKSPALSVKSKVDEGVMDDARKELADYRKVRARNVPLIDVIGVVAMKFLKSTVKKITSWAGKFDKKLAALKVKAGI